MLPSHIQKNGLIANLKKSGMGLFLGLAAVVILVMGVFAAYSLTGKSQELRQQAAGRNCERWHNDESSCISNQCTYQRLVPSCGGLTASQCQQFGCDRVYVDDCIGTASNCRIYNSLSTCTTQAGCGWTRIGNTNAYHCTTIYGSCSDFRNASALCEQRDGCQVVANGYYSGCTGSPNGICYDPTQTPPAATPTPVASANPSSCSPGSASFCQNPGNTTNLCKCVGVTGGNYVWNCNTQDPQACPVGGGGGGTGGGTVNCRQYDGNMAGCNAVAPVNSNGNSETCGYYNCSNQCHPVGTSNCAAGCSDQCGTGGGGGGTTSSPTPNPWGARTVTGKISCAVNNKPVSNVPVVAFSGRTILPQFVVGSAKTNTAGQYSINLNIEDSLFTLRLTANNQDGDKAFKRSGNPGITCTDNLAYEVCQYLQIPVGTTKAGFDYTTSAQATNLRAYQADGTNVVFEFKMAKNTLNQYIQKYVVRLDYKADSWFNSNSDYFLTVPKVGTSGTGTCNTSTGICKITSAELNAIRTFKYGNYGMGVNPIWDSQVAGQTRVELCRADANVTAAVTNTPPGVPECGSGYTCQAKSQGQPTGNPFLCSTNYQGTYAEWYCCPVKGQVILNGRCATVGKLTPQ